MRLQLRTGPLTDRSFRQLFFGQAVSLLGDGIAPVAIAFAILGGGGTATDLGMILATRSVVLVALVIGGGVLADRMSPRLAMLRANLVRLVVMGVIAALVIGEIQRVWEIALLYATDGVAIALFNPASNAMIPIIVAREDLQEANALFNLTRSIGQIAGPVLAGLLLAVATPGLALAVDAATFGVSAWCLLSIPGTRPEIARRHFLHELREGWVEFSSRTWLWVCVGAAAVVNAVFFPGMQVLGPSIAKSSLGGSSAWALIAAALGAGALVGGAFALTLRPRRPLLLGQIAMIGSALPLALLAAGASTWTVAVAAFAGGAALSLSEVLYETVAQQQIPARVMARVSAYDWFGSLVLQPAAFAVIGPVAAGAGTSTVLWICVGILVVCQTAAVMVPSVRRMTRSDPLPLAPSPEAAIGPGD